MDQMNTFFSVEPFLSWLLREDGFCLHFCFLLNNGGSDFYADYFSVKFFHIRNALGLPAVAQTLISILAMQLKMKQEKRAARSV